MRKKIIRNSIILVTIVIILTFTSVTGLMYTYALNVLTTGTEYEAQLLETMIQNNGLDLLQDISLKGQEQRITVVDPDGQVIFDSDVDIESMDNHKKRPEIYKALHSGVGSSLRNSDTLDKKVYYYALRLSDGNVLRISDSMNSIYFMIVDMIPYMFVLLLVIILVTIVLIRIETDRMIRPINEMNLDRPLEETTYEELKPLLTRMDLQNKRIHRQMEELKQAEGMRREFSANVSHELKTPLMAISGYAEIISCNMVRPEDIPEFSGRIYKEATRMTSLIEDIIKLSRLDEQSGDLPFESVDLKGMTDEVVDMLQVVAEKNHVTVEVDGNTTYIEGVHQVIHEMLHNLCENAIKYNRQGGSVKIFIDSMDPVGKFVRWSVQDTGIGIPKNEQERIFERFYRVDKSHSRETGGTGLGLAIVKHGAQLHDARLEIDSEVGEGTKISVVFPVDRCV